MFYLPNCCAHLMKRYYLLGKAAFAITLALFIPLMAQSCGGKDGGGGSGSGTVNATITWTAPTQNTDLTPLTDLAGFKIYYSTEATVPIANRSVQTAAVGDTTAVVSGLQKNTRYYFAVSAYDTSFNESAISNILPFH